jgi:Cu-Zn family superoxide dismutase
MKPFVLVAVVLLMGSLQAQSPRYRFLDAKGLIVGTVRMTPMAGGVRLTLDLKDAELGTRAVHVHASGRCDPPSFESAGAHLNPLKRQHGTRNPNGPHVGDLPNVTITKVAPSTVINLMVGGVTVEELLDVDGSSVVMHGDSDDYLTDPAGMSGPRVACASLVRPFVSPE